MSALANRESVCVLGVIAFLKRDIIRAAFGLYEEIVNVLQLHRKEIENVIGDFEIPQFKQMVVFRSQVKGRDGLIREAINYAFGFEVSRNRQQQIICFV
jgi:hypothetical protein